MPANKKHHYVPRFYLKRFSADKKRICLYNIKSGKKIVGANLKNQCYKDYFYGKEQVFERTLGEIEAVTSEIFNIIEQRNTLPSWDSEEYIMLIFFILIQHSRTRYSTDALDEMIDKVMKHICGPVAKEKGLDISEVKIGFRDVAQYSVAMTVQNYPILLDLHCKLLKNCSEMEFITSDNPVVLYNQFMAYRKSGSNTGYASKGLQIFFPIDPKNLMFFYDSEIYRVGNKKKKIIEVTDVGDIFKINTLQICSCLENIYFLDQHFDCELLYKKATPFFRKIKAKVESFPQYENEGGYGELMRMCREDIITRLNLSFLTIKKSAKKWRNEFRKQSVQPAVVVRKEQLCKDHRDFLKAVQKKQYDPLDFFSFVNNKYNLSN